MSGRFAESDVAAAALAWIEGVGWRIAHLPEPQTDLSACGLAPAGMPPCGTAGTWSVSGLAISRRQKVQSAALTLLMTLSKTTQHDE